MAPTMSADATASRAIARYRLNAPTIPVCSARTGPRLDEVTAVGHASHARQQALTTVVDSRGDEALPHVLSSRCTSVECRVGAPGDAPCSHIRLTTDVDVARGDLSPERAAVPCPAT